MIKRIESDIDRKNSFQDILNHLEENKEVLQDHDSLKHIGETNTFLFIIWLITFLLQYYTGEKLLENAGFIFKQLNQQRLREKNLAKFIRKKFPK